MAETMTTPASGAPAAASQGGLVTAYGKTTIASSVVAKIAGIAAREVSGVHDMGSGTARTVGALKERIGSSTPSVARGVNVEVGERQAAIDLDIVVEYGPPIVDLSTAVRENVRQRVQRMTGLEVTEVNVFVDDIHLPQEASAAVPDRVQ